MKFTNQSREEIREELAKILSEVQELTYNKINDDIKDDINKVFEIALKYDFYITLDYNWKHDFVEKLIAAKIKERIGDIDYEFIHAYGYITPVYIEITDISKLPPPRYSLTFKDSIITAIEDNENGEWVKWKDIKELY